MGVLTRQPDRGTDLVASPCFSLLRLYIFGDTGVWGLRATEVEARNERQLCWEAVRSLPELARSTLRPALMDSVWLFSAGVMWVLSYVNKCVCSEPAWEVGMSPGTLWIWLCRMTHVKAPQAGMMRGGGGGGGRRGWGGGGGCLFILHTLSLLVS